MGLRRGVARTRRRTLSGILNGIDTVEPGTPRPSDPMLGAHYGAADPERRGGTCKIDAATRHMGLDADRRCALLFGVVSRLS